MGDSAVNVGSVSVHLTGLWLKKTKKKKVTTTRLSPRIVGRGTITTILDAHECGIVRGHRVKSLREGRASLVDSFATIDEGEVWLHVISTFPNIPWVPGPNHSPRRTRKLLLHRREIDSLMGKVRDGNKTLVPLRLYFSNGRLKVELGLAQGKQDYDKRQDLKRRAEEHAILPANLGAE